MDAVTAQNMAKGLNVYRTGPKGAALRESLPSSGQFVTAVAVTITGKSLPPLKLKGLRKSASK